MKKYISSILLVLIFAAAVWAFIYEKNRAEQSGNGRDRFRSVKKLKLRLNYV